MLEFVIKYNVKPPMDIVFTPMKSLVASHPFGLTPMKSLVASHPFGLTPMKSLVASHPFS